VRSASLPSPFLYRRGERRFSRVSTVRDIPSVEIFGGLESEGDTRKCGAGERVHAASVE